MVNDSVPIEIGGEKYLLQFTDKDVMAIEQQFRPIHQMFMPMNFGFDMARIFVWKGLKKEQQDGTLIYAFTQDAKGYDDALTEIKKFTSHHNGPSIGLSFIFDMVDAALVASGWYSRTPKVSNTKREVDPEKKISEAYEEANQEVAYGICGLTPEQFKRMTPAAFSVFADARIKDRHNQLKHQDKLFAALSARLMYMQGRVSEDRIDPETCLSFDWDETPPEETTEDLMKTIRERMRGWVARTGGEHG